MSSDVASSFICHQRWRDDAAKKPSPANFYEKSTAGITLKQIQMFFKCHFVFDILLPKHGPALSSDLAQNVRFDETNVKV